MIEIMPTEIYQVEKLAMRDGGTEVIMYLNGEDNIYVTNNDTEDFDATTFWFTISKGDWIEIKKFIDKQFEI